MPGHALAFVDFRNFSMSPENRQMYSRAYWYVSRAPRVVNLVADGGTLWVVTSRRQKKRRVYSLAYKLVDCRRFVVWDQLEPKFGKHGVQGDPRQSLHFPSNDVADVLLSLKFSPEKPIKGREVIGQSVQTARSLCSEDVEALENYADKVLHGKNIFLSYSTKDAIFADAFQEAMEVRGHSVFRDVTSIVGGELWKRALHKALKTSHTFVVLVSENSAASDWVRREVRKADKMVGRLGGLRLLLPIVLSAGAWADFKEIHRFQKREWAKPSPQEFFDKVAGELGSTA